jgi:hypothetical protein
MNIDKKHLLIFALFLYSFTAYGQDMQIFPKIVGLNQFDLPEVSSKVWYDLCNSFKRQYYIDEYGSITIKNEEQIYRHIFEYDGGTFIGNNRGEWGGELIYRNDTNEYKILNENICGIINYNNEIYVLAGLTHLVMSIGKIIKLEKKNGIWERTSIIELNSSPETYTVFNNQLYIVTFNGLITFDGNNIKQILSRQFWSGLYPKTMYVNERIIAIGMRGCIAIINKETNEIKCYK